MNAKKILLSALSRKYNRLMSEYASLQHGCAEQEQVAEEMETTFDEIYRLRFEQDITQDNNWGQDALDMFSAADDEIFREGCGWPITPTDRLFFQGKFDEYCKSIRNGSN